MPLRAGAARVVVTPPVGVELAGYGFGPSAGILEDLHAQAIVVACGQSQIAFVAADVLMFGRRFVERVRRRVEAELGIESSHVLLSASHSHSSPTLMSLRQWGRVDEAYARALEGHLVGAIAMAQKDACEAHIGVGEGQLSNISENRRASGGPIDPAAPVLRIDDAGNGRPIAVLAGFGCHSVSLHSYRNMLSPDYPGTTRTVVQDVLGQETVVAFVLGPAGDVNPAGYVAGQTTPQRSRQIGAILGCEVARIALDPLYGGDTSLNIVVSTVQLPLEPLPEPADLRRMHAHYEATAAHMEFEDRSWADISVAQIHRDWAADGLQARASGGIRPTVDCEITALRVGGAAIVACPLEVFTETGLAIKRASPAQLTIVCTNANGAVGYLPTRDAYQMRDYTNPEGLAPKVYGLQALSPGAEPLFRETAIDMVRQLF